ncbi:polyprenyl synthetase family protein [Histidinibacterium aquaticum]|uniref:Geranylgeranyl diphosphate synthase n=1 Tax=Histidinibacterium aquaticum TaxID=2613962 RepID=A0A5J5GFE7_9RHOB|nr:polyprenyl synthetase family protein [Histidinibacterium aquaticum]KAA9006966.1 polyprenyl synthetase family protein [Histidinibacterium aquaticum]
MVDGRLAEAGARIRDHLRESVPPSGVAEADLLGEAVAYASEGGKAVRGALVLESCAICGVDAGAALKAASAIEAIHAYSLVHDDLPAMDDDDMRRGRPTLHRAYGEALAILAGDALQSLAFDRLAAITEAPPERVLALVGALARDAGPRGMVEGQWLDMRAESHPLPESAPMEDRLRRIEDIQSRKTGALLRWSCEAGPILGGQDPAPFRAYADAVGLAFQVRDDLLDVEGSAEETGKAVGKDAAAGKATFVGLLGVDGARAKAGALLDEALAALDPFGPSADFLRELARFIVTRDR